jgi:alkylation response protein AidB-like acyl-CoA dehydrogenase
MSLDASGTQDLDALAARIRSFLEAEVYPLEGAETEMTHERLLSLRDAARQAGVYGPQIGREHGGLGLSLEHLPPIFEAAGRSLLGPLALNCSAPDEGNIHTLELAATPAQRTRYLRPLAEGHVRSAFAMTEPAPGAGSDPNAIRTSARRDGDSYVLDGHKWFITGAEGAAFFLVMARSRPDGPAAKGCTIFLVDAGTPGLSIVRRVPVLGGHVPGGHCELRLAGVRVSAEQILGEEHGGFALAQRRLGPARLTHCMRWTGAAQRALELAIDHARSREAFGGALADKQAVQWMLADSHTELELGRLMIRHAAARLTTGDEARVECAMAKVHVAESVNRVLDRAIQVCGALGISGDLPIATMFAEARAFRIYDGASEVHRMVIARELLRTPR